MPTPRSLPPDFLAILDDLARCRAEARSLGLPIGARHLAPQFLALAGQLADALRPEANDLFRLVRDWDRRMGDRGFAAKGCRLALAMLAINEVGLFDDPQLAPEGGRPGL